MKSHLIAAAAITASIIAAPCVVAGVVDFNADAPAHHGTPYFFDDGVLGPVVLSLPGSGAGSRGGVSWPYNIEPVAKLFGSNPGPDGMSGNVLRSDPFYALDIYFDRPVGAFSFDYSFGIPADKRDPSSSLGAIVLTFAPGVYDHYSGVFLHTAGSPIFPGADGGLPDDLGFIGGHAAAGGVGPIGEAFVLFGVEIEPALRDLAGASRGELPVSSAFLFDNLVYQEVVPLPSGAAMGLAGLGLAAAIRRRR